MNTPVNFELAKLLKGKGFNDIECEGYYHVCDGYTKGYAHCYSNVNTQEETSILAPTIAEVVMWLYEKYEIWIEVSLTDNSRNFYFDYTIITSTDRDYNDEDCFDSAKRIYDKEKHNSPSKAYEAAIEYTLKNLIN